MLPSSQTETVIVETEEEVKGEEIVELPEESSEIKPTETTTQVAVEQEQEKEQEVPVQIIQTSSKEESKASRTSPHDVDMSYLRRLAAGSTWITGVSKGKFTIQLMVLTSENGVENLKKILAKKTYYEIADKLFILRKPAAPSMVLVYYGEYESMKDARNARNSMPVFLRKHHPYSISIKGAVDKIKVR